MSAAHLFHSVLFLQVSLSSKVDVNYLPVEEPIRRTDKPNVVRKLQPTRPREALRMPEKEPTKVRGRAGRGGAGRGGVGRAGQGGEGWCRVGQCRVVPLKEGGVG